MNCLLSSVLTLAIVFVLQPWKAQSLHHCVEPYNITTPVSVENVANCTSTVNFISGLFQYQAARVITNALCDEVTLDATDKPREIIYFCGNFSQIIPRDVRLLEITVPPGDTILNITGKTTFHMFTIVRFAGSAYVVDNDIVAQTITNANGLQLFQTSCSPLSSDSTSVPDAYVASAVSGMSIFASIVLILEVIIVGLFTVIWMNCGMGHLVTSTSQQAALEGVEEAITGL